MISTKMLKSAVAIAFGQVKGLSVRCSWSNIESQVYDPVSGKYDDVTSAAGFSAIKGVYRTKEKVQGVESGDFPLYVEAEKFLSKPKKGSLIVVDSEECELVNIDDVQGALYIMQMRRK